ncbi:transketolase [Nocardia callitridis]|uniref:Transketolase n=1 Tax=Nocardia callitridis TaxID=648753 RepID=A0ABP9KKP5_9NOCA
MTTRTVSDNGPRLDPVDPVRVRRLREAALRIRHNALTQAEVQGQGYIGQALDLADVLAVLYLDQMKLRAAEPEWEERDRCLLSVGHYAIALYAVLAEAGFLPLEELDTYATDESRLPMSGMAGYTPGMEISGGSLGHGLGIAVGKALGLRRKDNPAHVYTILSDGELDEGSTWEAVQACVHLELDNVIAVVDMNNQQADGPAQSVLGTEPVHEKFAVNGWYVRRVDGHDIPALIEALADLKSHRGHPKALICDTVLGKGVPMLETREKLHFMAVAPEEWALTHRQLDEGFQA